MRRVFQASTALESRLRQLACVHNLFGVACAKLAPEADDDRDNVRGYIGDHPDATDRVIIEIFDSIRNLISFPSPL
jgi:hypothetical protein